MYWSTYPVSTLSGSFKSIKLILWTMYNRKTLHDLLNYYSHSWLLFIALMECENRIFVVFTSGYCLDSYIFLFSLMVHWALFLVFFTFHFLVNLFCITQILCTLLKFWSLIFMMSREIALKCELYYIFHYGIVFSPYQVSCRRWPHGNTEDRKRHKGCRLNLMIGRLGGMDSYYLFII